MVALSPIIDDCNYKKIIFILISFICLQFLVRYGKCGLVNIEKFILRDKFRKGFLFKLIRPVISYRFNPFYSEYFPLLLVYILILYIQTDIKGCRINMIKETAEAFNILYKLIKK
jgi:hypothetical protein